MKRHLNETETGTSEAVVEDPTTMSRRRKPPPHDSFFQMEPISFHEDEDEHRLTFRRSAAFWCLGVLNNASYVLMISFAKTLNDGGTGIIFLVDLLPILLIKMSAPYWFDSVSYNARISMASLSTVLAFSILGTFENYYLRLVGVAFASVQCGLGEASLLGLAGRLDSQGSATQKGHCLTSFSSGAGFAGVFTFAFKWFCSDWMGWTMARTTWIAQVFALLYWGIYYKVLWKATGISLKSDKIASHPTEDQPLLVEGFSEQRNTHSCGSAAPLDTMGGSQRFQLVLSLWPYMTPLFMIFFFGYIMAAGVWSGIGLPQVGIPEDRQRFFTYANWSNQAGDFLSRTSGVFWTAPLPVLWLLPMLQGLHVTWFAYMAVHSQSRLYSGWVLYPNCFLFGSMGGSIYISAYKRICQDIPTEYREFSLSAASVADAFGVLVADVFGLFIQSCLYQHNGIPGAVVTCPIKPK